VTDASLSERGTRDAEALESPLARVAVVYGSPWFNPIVLAEAARETPCRLLWVLDGRDAETAPQARFLDRVGDVVDVAGLDVPSTAAALRPFAPSAITTFSDFLMPLTAALARQLSLVYHSELTAGWLSDKSQQRLALHAAGVPGPAVWTVPGEPKEWPAFVAQLRFPVVVKPRRGTGSVATARADDEGELSGLLARFADVDGGLLVEEYLVGRDHAGPFADDFAVELMVQEGHVFRLATTGKFTHAPPFRGRGTFLPSHVDPPIETALFDAAEAATVALGIRDSFVNVDVKLTPDGPRVVEVNGRLGGHVQLLMELAGGPPVLPLVFRLALGRAMAEDPAVTRILGDGWSAVGYFASVQVPMEATRLLGVTGFDDVAALPHVSIVLRKGRQGDSFDWTEGANSGVCEVFGSVERIENLAAARRQIDDLIEVEFEGTADGA